MDVPSPSAGVVEAIHVEVGAEVEEDQVILALATEPGPLKRPASVPAEAVSMLRVKRCDTMYILLMP